MKNILCNLPLLILTLVLADGCNGTVKPKPTAVAAPDATKLTAPASKPTEEMVLAQPLESADPGEKPPAEPAPASRESAAALAAWNAITDLHTAGDFVAIWGHIAKPTQTKIEGGMLIYARISPLIKDEEQRQTILKLSGKELFAQMCAVDASIAEKFAKRNIKSVQAGDDHAALTAVDGAGDQAREETIHMLKENGVWKWALE